MSRHYHDTVHHDRKIRTTIGFDRPLQTFFMSVLYTDSQDSSAADTSASEDDDCITVYSDLWDPDATSIRDLAYFRAKLASIGITVPESMFRETGTDATQNVGNRIARHFADGRFEEVTALGSGAADKDRDAAQMLIETVNATGELISLPNGLYAPAADPEWIDLGEAYFKACSEKEVEPTIYDDANLAGD